MEKNQFQFDESTALTLLLIILAFILGRQLPRWLAGVPYVRADKAKEQIDADPNTLVLDVRAPGQFSKGHMPNAYNLPLLDLINRVKKIKDELGGYADSPILVVCKNDQLSARAGRLLRKNGMSQVAILDGGFKAWKKAKMPIEGAAE